MTKPEVTGTRDLTFSQWIREKLPDSRTGFMVSDLDFILYDYNHKKLMLLEVKTRNAIIHQWQNILFNKVAGWIARGINEGWQFKGFHKVIFTGSKLFEDGKCRLDDKQIDEQELIEFLSMR